MTLKEVAPKIGMGYDSLAELCRKYPNVREWLQARREHGAWNYPPHSMAKFEQIGRLHRGGMPLKGIANAVEQAEQTANAETPNEAEANGQEVEANEVQLGTNVLIDQRALALLAEAIGQAMRKHLPPPDDELLSMAEAHRRYGISYATLRSLPRKRDGRKWKIRRSDVLRWLQQE